MGFFKSFFDLFSSDDSTSSIDDAMETPSMGSEINPATGLPMVSGDTSGVDVGGNLYGMSNDDIGGITDSGMDDSFSTDDDVFGGGFDSDW